MANKVRSIQRAAAQAEAREAEIKVTLEDLLKSQQALQSLANQPMPARHAFRLSKILKQVAKELETLNETRLKLCEEYGKKNKAGSFEFSKANEAKINAEFEDLIKTEVVLRGELLDLDGLPGLTITASSVVLLTWLVECSSR